MQQPRDGDFARRMPDSFAQRLVLFELRTFLFDALRELIVLAAARVVFLQRTCKQATAGTRRSAHVALTA